MSQRVKITRARVHGSSVYLGEVTQPDGTVAPVWSADPDEVLGWLCDGFRFRFNQRRSTRCRYLTCEDRAGSRWWCATRPASRCWCRSVTLSPTSPTLRRADNIVFWRRCRVRSGGDT
ncbi:putative transposase [Mycobacterium xenopi 4042]|uniref:Putative transposase n=1 Tax=Mycobacterium xenopi 4042 TaxID=1299334 RepID=X8DA46_MYCXE|nr:putative transposase [Mycobacterium xenopi 4042]